MIIKRSPRKYTPEEKRALVQEYIRLRPTMGDVHAYRAINQSPTLLRKWAAELKIPIPRVDKSITMNIKNGNLPLPCATSPST